jgi:fumarate reductase flavoprotein subunit
LILACGGYGGNRTLLRRFIPAIADAHYHGHEGIQGDALQWGEELGASMRDTGSFQGHGAVCTPHMIHLGWPVITEGGIQVNHAGVRFSNENAGYSEQALNVLRQPDSVAWAIWDDRCEAVARQMHSHRLCASHGAIKRFTSAESLAQFIGAPLHALQHTLDDTESIARGHAQCPFGRDFGSKPPLAPPYLCAKVTGALFHTQGGLEVDKSAKVLRKDGTAFPNLFAGGGAARGLSGPSDWGYLSGSGLLMAANLGYLAGKSAADLIQ